MKIENAVHVGDKLDEVYASLIDMKDRRKDLEITSIPKLDDLLWGLNRQKLVIIGGRTSQGKSTLMLQMAFDFAKKGKVVLFFSLEMTLTVCLTRLICSHCEIDNRIIQTGQLYKFDAENSKNMTKLNEELKKAKFMIIQSEGKTFGDINQMVEMISEPVDAVFIDHIQQIKTPSKKNKKEAIDDYLINLRAYAIQKNFCAIVGSQINRGTHDGHKIRKPALWELKETGSLEEHADLVLLLHWESFYSTEETNAEFLINVAKNRDGETGAINCAFLPQFYKIKESHGPEPDSIAKNEENRKQDRNPYR